MNRKVKNNDIQELVSELTCGDQLSSIQKFKDPKIRESISNQALSDFSRYTWKNRASLVI